MALEFAQRIRRIPVYPAADGYALPDESVALLASNESPVPPLPAVVEAAARALEGANRYPDPTSARLRARAGRSLRRAGRADRRGQRLLRHPAGRGRGAARARRRGGLRVAVVLDLPAPGGGVRRHRGHRAARRRRPPRPAGDGRRGDGGHAAGARLQPQQPDEHGGPAGRDRGAARARAAPRLRDRRRGLLRVQRARGPRRLARPARRRTPTWCCCARSPRSTGCAGCASASGCAARRSCARRSTRCASRSSATRPRRPPPSRRSRHQDEVARRVERTIAGPPLGLDEGLRGLGLTPAESQANFVWFEPRGRTANARRRSWSRPGRAQGARARRRGAGPRGRAARHLSAPESENRRFLVGLHELLS